MVNKKIRQHFSCPRCGSPTRNTKTRGDITLKKCDACGECTKVLLNSDHTEVIKVFEKGERECGSKNLGLQAHITQSCCMEEAKTYRPKQSEGVLISLDENTMTYEEQIKIIEDFMKAIKGE